MLMVGTLQEEAVIFHSIPLRISTSVRARHTPAGPRLALRGITEEKEEEPPARAVIRYSVCFSRVVSSVFCKNRRNKFTFYLLFLFPPELLCIIIVSC